MEGQQQSIELGHLLKGILEVDESGALCFQKKLGVNFDAIRQATDSIVYSYPKVSGGGSQYMSRLRRGVAEYQYLFERVDDEFVALEHLLLGIIATKRQRIADAER